MTTPYRIVGLVTLGSKVETIIHGPGIEPGGLRQDFPSELEALGFVQMMNMAFEQGLKQGLHPAPKTSAAGSLP
jgi:hypothetical protein